MPMVPNNFSGLITFTRASGATFVGSNGLIQLAATNVPRFDYDPVTLAVKGLLIEEQRTNLLTYSEQFDNAAWALSEATVSANQTTAPDGTISADKLIETTATSNHQINLPLYPATGTFTSSFYAKAAERNFAVITFASSDNPRKWFNGIVNLSNGDSKVLSTINSPVYSNFTATLVGNGWYRISVQVTNNVITPVLTGFLFGINISDSYTPSVDTVGRPSYTGDGTSGIYIWGAQLEAGSFPTSYIPTVASQVTRSADVASVNTLSPWYNAAEGTLFADYIISNAQVAGAPSIVSISDNTNANRIQLSHVSGDRRAVVTSVGVAEFAAVGGALGAASAGIAAKLAVAYKTSNFAACANSGSIISSASGSVPVGLSRITIGADGAANLQLNGTIRRITYLPRRLSNAELQTITA